MQYLSAKIQIFVTFSANNSLLRTKQISKNIQDKFLNSIHPKEIQYPWKEKSIIIPDEVDKMTINQGQTGGNERAEFFQVNAYRNLQAVVIKESNFSTTTCYEISSKLITMQLL